MTGNKSTFSLSSGFIYAVLGSYLLWVMYPMLWLGYSSFKPDEAIFRDPFAFPDPGNLEWTNYARAWTEAGFAHYFFNSVLVTSVSVALILFLGSTTAWALSRFSVPGRTFLFLLFLAGLMIPMQLSVVPLFFQMREMGLLNTRSGLILVYTANGLPFAVFILAGFFRSLPRALYEAASIDGCGHISAFRFVMLPLAVPGLVTVAIFQFIGIWKEYFFAFMFLSGAGGESVGTLPLGLANLAIAAEYRTDYGMLFSGLVFVILPLLLVYVFLQKKLVRGIAAGALKG